ncbi:MAG: GNAT family N-acetyltransferase [Paracoccaceae bacterium]
MSASLHLCVADDLDVILPLVAAFYEHEGIQRSQAELRTAVMPLLQGTPHGVAYLIGPRKAPVGYIVISFGYSVEFGGIDGFIDEFFIRANVRGRGMGTEVLSSILPALSEHGVKALHLEVSQKNRAEKIYSRAGFKMRDGYHLMTRVFS